VSSQDYFLILDADTVLIRPQVFELNNKVVSLHSDEHHQPYFDLYEKIFRKYPSTDLSFVSHHILMNKSKLIELKKEIEDLNGGEKWYNVILNMIDRSNSSCMSEYEIYGHWTLQNYVDQIIREYWYNFAMSADNLMELSELAEKFSDRYRSLSFHSYL
jgi:hypothetical protein